MREKGKIGFLALTISMVLSSCGEPAKDFIGKSIVGTEMGFKQTYVYVGDEEIHEKNEEYYSQTDRIFEEKLREMFLAEGYVKDENELDGYDEYGNYSGKYGICFTYRYYIEKKLKNQGYNVIYDYESEGKYKCQKIDDIVALVDQDGDVLVNESRVLLSENQKIMGILDEMKIGDYIRKADKAVLKSVGSETDNLTRTVLLLMYERRIIYSDRAFAFNAEYGTYSTTENKDWLYGLYQKDGWSIEKSGKNSVCDSVMYSMVTNLWLESGKWEYNEEFLYVYGKDKKVKEIKLVLMENKISEPGKASVIKYLEALGMTESDAEKFVDDIPDKSQKIYGVNCNVEKGKKTYTVKVWMDEK